jgi:hypothetical protein
MEQYTIVLSKTLLNNHRCYTPTTYEMTQQTLRFMVDVHASSCSVISWSVQKPFDYTTYFVTCIENLINHFLQHDSHQRSVNVYEACIHQESTVFLSVVTS